MNNRAVILLGGGYQRTTVGNKNVAKRYASKSVNRTRLHLHHIFFKGIRASFTAIPYLYVSTKRTPQFYHADRISTDIDFSTLTNMKDYVYETRLPISNVSRQDNRNIYPDICIKACQLY